MAVSVSRFGMGDENRQNVHPFFAPRDYATNPTEELGNQRKRRRTNSPISGALVVQSRSTNSANHDNSEEWENQLRTAAYGEHSIPIGNQGSVQTVKVESGKHDTTGSHVPEPICFSNTAKGTLSVLQVEITKSKLGGYGNKNTTSSKEQTTINTGGKLVSPRSQSLASNPNSKRKKRDLKDDIKQKVVKIKYGSTDESRQIMALKIQEICSGTIVRSNDEIKKPKVSEPVMASKPTHPFFLGTSSRTKEPRAIHETATEGYATSRKYEGGQDMDNEPQKESFPKELPSNANAFKNLPIRKEISHSLGQLRPIRHTGPMDPIWPPKDMAHVRPLIHEITTSSAFNIRIPASYRRRKLKYAKVHVAEKDEILQPYLSLVSPQAMCKGNIKREYTKRFGRPSREVMTGSELQNATRPLLAHSLPNLQPLYFQEGSSGGFDTLPETNHSALLRIFKDICFSRTAFDRFECETLDWAHKYAPRRAEEVLQSGREALVLRDWLKSLTVTSVGSGSSELPKGQDKSIPSRRLEAYSKRKKRKRAEELDGFVISSDEEAVEMEELANPEIYENTGHAFSGKKSVVRVANISGRPAEGHRSVNAIVISGPHGCGKTAAVYAVARELDFEVFEINSGSRRSGKDIIEKVGDMTKNHLVNQACETKVDELAKGIPISTESLTPGVRSSCQSNGKPVLKPKAEVKKKPRGRPKFHAKPLENNDNLKKTKQSQKQSLILLEEVDVLFEEDRQFWATTLDLILHSKRPIIMTCSDENFLPLDEMILFAVLRFTPPPEPLAIDYLILIASSEGHLLSRKSLSTLLQYKHFDLRASITELNFFCQMAIGDTKGGLEWMMVQPSPTNKQTREDKNSRVVSVGTYGKHLSYIDRMEPNLETQLFIDKAKNYSSKIWERWNADADYSRECRLTPSMVKHSQVKQEHALQRLMAFEQVLDAISAADTHLFSEHRQSNLTILDKSLPEVSERFRTNFVEGATVLQAEPIVDQSGVGTLLSSAVRAYATQIHCEGVDGPFTLPDDEDAAQLIPEVALRVPLATKITRTTISTAFDSIAGPSRPPLTEQRGSHISAFDGPISSVLEDVAPYVRSIVFYDLKLEEHRLQLNSLLAQNGRNGKRMRTTRASHAALEGGSKAHTRREKWFPIDSNSTLILQSGGDGWQEIAWQRTLDQTNLEL